MKKPLTPALLALLLAPVTSDAREKERRPQLSEAALKPAAAPVRGPADGLQPARLEPVLTLQTATFGPRLDDAAWRAQFPIKKTPAVR